MDPKRYQRLKDLVDQALELPEIERDIYLQNSCGDADLLSEARDLLHHYRPETQGATKNVGLTANLPDMVNRKIGPYQIIKPLGEGGMGVVYLAAQSAPLRRKVAVKIIKLGMDTREVIARFESERQALALMDHPNIAKVYDAGATDEGRPFFVMEYIPGIPLNQYCDDHQQGLRQRLDLFIRVCGGVQHAHQKGIIHRDLKPGNILVTEVEGKPVPKIIDFGVAKATIQHLTIQTLFTQMGQMIGTPEYMSPEQAGSSSEDVDTRSDVYSLGVLLYELLTGVVPLERRDIMRAGLERMALLVQNEIPKKPSTRIDTSAKLPDDSAKLHVADTRTWAKRIRGDLDWITMKALEKDRTRRYGSAADLAMDLARHLENRTVSAGPPSRVYRMRKFVRRNRAGVAMAALVLMALVGFATWQTMQSRVISRERDKAMANERLSHASGQIAKDPTVAVAYALSSLEILDQPNARDVVRQAIARSPLRNELPRCGQRGNPITVNASPDGRHAVVAWSQTKHQTVGVYSLEDYSMRTFEAPGEGIAYQAIFNSDGSHVLSNGNGGIHVWRVSDGQHLHHLDFVNEYSSSVLYRIANPQKMAVCANRPGEQTVWFELDLHEGSIGELGKSRGTQHNQDNHVPAIDEVATRVLDYDSTRVYLQRFEDLGTDRAIFVGEHEASISSVAFDASCEVAASADVEGHIKVWNLMTSPPQLLREFKENPGAYEVKFDPHGNRFYSSWGSDTIHIYDLADTPPHRSVALMDRAHWTHSGTFFPDGSLLAGRNGIRVGAVAHWKTSYPVAWSLDFSERSGVYLYPSILRDGRILYIWEPEGGLTGLPLIGGLSEGVGSLGKTRGWSRGEYSHMMSDPEGKWALTFCWGSEVLDFESGEARNLPGVEDMLMPEIVSPSGRHVCFFEMTGMENFHVYDLDSLKMTAVIDLKGQEYESFCFSGETALVALGGDHLVKFDITNPTADPDTLWRGDASNGGSVLQDGNFALVSDVDRRLSWVDLKNDREIELGTTPQRPTQVDYHPGRGLVAVAGWWNTIEVFNIENGEHWTLPVLGEGQQGTYYILFDPLGRWLLAMFDSQIMAWTLPLDPMFGRPEYDDLMESLRSLTNVRVVPDETKPNGFKITNTLDMEH